MWKALLEQTLEASTFACLRSVAFDYFSGLGASRLSYHHYPPLGAVDYTPKITVAAVGYPDSWINTYMKQELYKDDPIIRHAAIATRPFRWEDIQDLTELSAAEKRFLSFVSEYEVGEGLAVPVFGPHGRNGYFGVGYLNSACPIDLRIQAEIQMGCQLVHLRYCELLREALPHLPDLSSQERTVLQLVSQGLTNSAIADQMRVSKKTVATYLGRCFDKLDVHDRMTAALRALAAGLLD